MDKTYFIEVDNVFEENKMLYKHTNIPEGLDTERYARTVILQFLNLLKHYTVDLNSHIGNVTHYIDIDDRIILNVPMQQGKVSKKHISNRLGVLKKAPSSPINLIVKSDTKEYVFTLYNIEDKINKDCPGVYLFLVMVEDGRANREYTFSILKFESISDDNTESIAFAKANGALQFAYYSSYAEYERQDIIEDIKNSADYNYQLETFPDLVPIPTI